MPAPALTIDRIKRDDQYRQIRSGLRHRSRRAELSWRDRAADVPYCRRKAGQGTALCSGIYLQTQDESKFERTGETGSRSIAAAAVETLIKRDDLEKTPVTVHLVYLRTTLAIRQFDAREGAENNWHGALDQIP